MADLTTNSRFAPPSRSVDLASASTTHGVIALADFRKERADLIDQQGREALLNATPDRSQSNTPAGDGSGTSTPGETSNQPSAKAALIKKKKRARAGGGGSKLSFQDEEEEEEGDDGTAGLAASNAPKKAKKMNEANSSEPATTTTANTDGTEPNSPRKFKLAPNSNVAVVPRALTKSALQREAAEREVLRKQFLELQEAVKDTEIAIPFIFYDGTHIPGGMVRVKKGDFVWMFLDKSRKVGAKLKIGGGAKPLSRQNWARVSVDDLLLVRGTIIIPPHYDFYFFLQNKATGPGGVRLFDYSTDAPSHIPSAEEKAAAAIAAAAAEIDPTAAKPSIPPVSSLEGARDDPAFTKVVDRRWYERNKHIYPASVWQEYDPEKSYTDEIRRDTGGNAFFFSR